MAHSIRFSTGGYGYSEAGSEYSYSAAPKQYQFENLTHSKTRSKFELNQKPILNFNDDYAATSEYNNKKDEFYSALNALVSEQQSEYLNTKHIADETLIGSIPKQEDQLSHHSTAKEYDESVKSSESCLNYILNKNNATMGQYQYVEPERCIIKKQESKLETAFKQLAQGKYPTPKEEAQGRDMVNDCDIKTEKFYEKPYDYTEKVFDDVEKPIYPQAIAPSLNDFHNILGVESVRQKVYLDDKWRKVTKTEHIVVHLSGQRFKILTKQIQTVEGKVSNRQKITPM